MQGVEDGRNQSNAGKLQVSAMQVFSTIQFQPIFLSFSESSLTCFLSQKFWSKALIALIDDIATLLDDVSVMTKISAKKTAGVLGASRTDFVLSSEIIVIAPGRTILIFAPYLMKTLSVVGAILLAVISPIQRLRGKPAPQT